MARPVFKQTNQNQTSMFPYDFDSYVPQTHPVRLINQIIDQIDISDIISTYKGGGTSSFHPKMLLKVLIYGYLNNLYSCRNIEKALKENIYFIWLSGQSFPDFRTINYFRGKRLKDKINNVFAQVVLFLNENGYVSLEEVFTDGTKMESVANRYTFVWKKNVERYKSNLEKKIKVVLNEIEEATYQDHKELTKKKKKKKDQPISSSELSDQIKKINANIKSARDSKAIKKKVNQLQKEALPKLMEYEEHLENLGDRNSYSKTDKDATFMRMKEDHMGNGQLKPAYNLQLSTENTFITNFGIYQNPGDTTTFQDHLNSFYEKFGKYPHRSIADAGYGSLENYDFLEEKGIDNFVKFNYFHKEQTPKFKLDISKVENLYYNEEEDYFVCPMGQKMRPVNKGTRLTRTGYEYDVTTYRAINCQGCPMRGPCHKNAGNREIEMNIKLYRHKIKVRETLNSDLGIKLRKRRCCEVEQIFGQIKGNKRFKRLLLKGLLKVNVEIGLLALAHNFQKMSSILTGKQGVDIMNQINSVSSDKYCVFIVFYSILEYRIIKSKKAKKIATKFTKLKEAA